MFTAPFQRGPIARCFDCRQLTSGSLDPLSTREVWGRYFGCDVSIYTQTPSCSHKTTIRTLLLANDITFFEARGS
jgi:hypothetical protein